MDGNRFDSVARSLAVTGSRRALLGGAGAALLAALGRGRGVDAQVSQAQCGNKLCRSNPGVCTDGCVCCVYTNPVTGTIINDRCRPPGTCGPGEAVCPPERPVVDPVRGCVGCRSAGDCPPPAPNSCQVATCIDGVCGIDFAADDTACGAGQVCCGGTCVSRTTNPNCGTCGNACGGASPVCSANGTCVACLSNTDCTRGNPCETGTCTDNVCSSTPLPQNAFRGDTLRCCGGQCVSNRTNTNCGTCGIVCPFGSTCSSIGACAV